MTVLRRATRAAFWRVFGQARVQDGDPGPVDRGFRATGALLLSAALAAPVAEAQTPELLPEFWITDDTVNAITSGPDAVYIGGHFNWVGPFTGTTVRIGEATGVVSTPYPRTDGFVYAVAPDGAGGWFFGGGLTQVNGVARHKVAHVLSDGRLADWSVTLTPANAIVYSLAVSGDRVYIGGNFSQVNGMARSGIAALDIATGAVLPWNPNAGTLPFVFSIVPAGDTVYLGGNFNTMGGQGRPNLAEVDATTGSVTTWNPGTDDSVFSIALVGNNAYVGGKFNFLGGQVRNFIGAVDRTTGLATGWNPDADATVRSLAVGGSTLYAGGAFDTIGGATREGLAALAVATGLATPWDPMGSPPAAQEVRAVAVSGNVVFAGGILSEVAGQPRSYLAAIDATTGLVTAWNPGASARVWALSVDAGWVFVGGEFGGAGGLPRGRLAAFDRASGAATSWNPDANGFVYGVAFGNDTIYTAGLFSEVGGLTRTRLAAVDLSGGVLPTWVSSADNSPVRLAVAADQLVVGGSFTMLGGSFRGKIGSLALDTGATTTWNPSIVGSSVDSLLVTGSTVFVGGSFLALGGSNRNYIAALDLTVPTSNALPFDPGADSPVGALALSGGTLFVGGSFSNLAGQARSRIGAVDALTGAIVPSFDPNALSTVQALAANPSRVFAGGDFNIIGGQSRSHLAALDPTTGLATAWSPSPDDTVWALHLAGNQLFVGGAFEGISAGWRQGFAAYCLVTVPTALVATASASPNTIDLAWTGSAPLYEIFRSRTSGGGYELIGQTAANAFSDTNAEGGIPYFYVVRAVDGCASGFSNEDSATATGGCTLPPDFEGLAWAQPGPAATCTIDLGWDVATSPCGGSVEYTVHRDTDPGFLPTVSNQLGTVTSTTFSDSFSLSPGTTHYYIVRAATTSGEEEDNLIRHAATATGGCTATIQGVERLAATATDQKVHLQWKNPPGEDTVVIHADSSDPCVFPSDPNPVAPTWLATLTAGAPGGVETWDHTPVTNDQTLCYSVFVYDGVSVFSGRKSVRSRPFDSTGKLKWAYSTAASTLAPPGIGAPGVIVTSNDRVVHALTRGAGGGVWPAGWIPPTIGGPAQSRPPVIPSPVISGATQFALVGAHDGSAYAIDALTGAVLWSEPLGDVVQAAPAGVFSAFGSIHDYVFVGAREISGQGVFYMLNADDGSIEDSFDNAPPGMGIISGQATVDYANDRVYFGSRDGGDGKTLWCLEFGAGTLTEKWSIGIGDIDGSPVVRDDTVYVGNVDGEVYAVEADTGNLLWGPFFPTNDGQPRAFVFPDRSSDDLYFATDTQVWGLSDLGPGASQNFTPVTLPASATPSTLLFAPGTTLLYVGGSDGRLYQIDVSGGPTLDPLTLGDGDAVIGAPTLDKGVVPNMIYVGSEEGVVYGVEVPLP